MAQYINKDTLVSEIENQQRKLCLASQFYEVELVELRKNAAIQNGVYVSLLSFINSLEVKEVDVEKESVSWIEENQDTAGFFDLVDYAKHFFDLGFKAQRGE